MIRLPAIILVALALVACGRSEPPAPVAMAPDSHLVLQQEMEKATMDFGRVYVVRLQRDGKRLEVASVAPTTIASATVGGQPAKTIFRINDRADALVLFSRDVPGHKSSKTEITFAQLAAKPRFSFPVVQPDGSLRDEQFAVEQIVQPPQ